MQLSAAQAGAAATCGAARGFLPLRPGGDQGRVRLAERLLCMPPLGRVIPAPSTGCGARVRWADLKRLAQRSGGTSVTVRFPVTDTGAGSKRETQIKTAQVRPYCTKGLYTALSLEAY